jgi:hypothetical protein
MALNFSISLASGEFFALPLLHDKHEDQFELQLACSGKNLEQSASEIDIIKKSTTHCSKS